MPEEKQHENQSQALIQALAELSVLSCSDRRGKGKAHKALTQALHNSVGSFSKRGNCRCKTAYREEETRHKAGS